MGFTYNRTITFDHTQVPSDQTNIPMAVFGTIASLKTVGNGGHVQSSSGFDIVFSTTQDGLSPIKWEVVNWQAASGLVEYWLKVPTLSSSVDTIIYMCYGNAAITTDQSDQTNTWDSNYCAVYHFGTAASLSLNDSNQTHGPNNLTGTGAPGPTTGLIGGCFPSSSSVPAYANTAGTATGVPTGANPTFTLECWQLKTTSGTGQEVGGWGNNGTNGARMTFFWSDDSHVGLESDGDANSFNAGSDHVNWHHLCATGVAANTIDNAIFYFDAIVKSMTPGGGISLNLSNHEIAIGTIPNAHVGNGFTGSIDEFRISTIVRSPNWITSQYNNTKNAATTPTIGSENTTGFTNVTISGDQFAWGDTTPTFAAGTMVLGLCEVIADSQAGNWADAILLNTSVPGIAFTENFVSFWLDSQTFELDGFLFFNDTLTLSDTNQPAKNMNAIIDNLALSDSQSVLVIVSLPISDTFTWTDSVKLVEVLSLPLSDSFTWSDLFQFNIPFNLAFSDFFIWRDAQVVAWSSVLPVFTDSFSLSDSVIVANVPFWTPVNEIISDVLVLSDGFNLNLSDNVVVSDLLSLIDQIGVALLVDPTHQQFSDSFHFTDGILIIVEGELLQFADTLVFSDNILVNNSTSFNSYIRRYLNDEPDI